MGIPNRLSEVLTEVGMITLSVRRDLDKRCALLQEYANLHSQYKPGDMVRVENRNGAHIVIALVPDFNETKEPRYFVMVRPIKTDISPFAGKVVGLWD